MTRRPSVVRREWWMLTATLALAACSSGVLTGTGPGGEDTGLVDAAANLTSLTEVVTRNPDDPQAYNMRGSVYGQSGQFKEALDDFNKAISLDPKYSQAYAN